MAQMTADQDQFLSGSTPAVYSNLETGKDKAGNVPKRGWHHEISA